MKLSSNRYPIPIYFKANLEALRKCDRSPSHCPSSSVARRRTSTWWRAGYIFIFGLLLGSPTLNAQIHEFPTPCSAQLNEKWIHYPGTDLVFYVHRNFKQVAQNDQSQTLPRVAVFEFCLDPDVGNSNHESLADRPAHVAYHVFDPTQLEAIESGVFKNKGVTKPSPDFFEEISADEFAALSGFSPTLHDPSPNLEPHPTLGFIFKTLHPENIQKRLLNPNFIWPLNKSKSNKPILGCYGSFVERSPSRREKKEEILILRNQSILKNFKNQIPLEIPQKQVISLQGRIHASGDLHFSVSHLPTEGIDSFPTIPEFEWIPPLRDGSLFTARGRFAAFSIHENPEMIEDNRNRSDIEEIANFQRLAYGSDEQSDTLLEFAYPLQCTGSEAVLNTWVKNLEKYLIDITQSRYTPY